MLIEYPKIKKRKCLTSQKITLFKKLYFIFLKSQGLWLQTKETTLSNLNGEGILLEGPQVAHRIMQVEKQVENKRARSWPRPSFFPRNSLRSTSTTGTPPRTHHHVLDSATWTLAAMSLTSDSTPAAAATVNELCP